MATTPNYDINYNDKRFTEVSADKKAALNEVDVTYGNMISGSDKFYNAQIDAANKYAEQQKQFQQQQTDFAIEKINQQKEQAKQDYTKEQSGAYVDWQKQSNEHGANAEQMAAQGMANTGYSESSQVSMFNTYQNRVATARESYLRTIQNFDNAINEAKIQNNALLAEIAYNAMQKGLELSLEGFQYKNQLIIDKSNKKLEVEQVYHNRYQDVLDQINKENALAEEVRQYNASMEQQKEIADAQLAEKQRQFNILHGRTTNSVAVNRTVGKGGKTSSGGRQIVTASNKLKDAVKSSVSTKTSSANKSNLTVDMQSVLNLGFGPISEKRLDELVRSGVVVEYQSGNKLKYKKSASTLKQSMLLGL